MIYVFTIILSLFLVLAPYLTATADEGLRMTKDELKELMGSPDVVIIDVRLGKDWKSSEFKIKGAVKESEKETKWAENYDKDKTIVLYCA